jgi:hypothetical protein
MGSSTVSLQSVVDNVVTQGAPNPLTHPSGYGTKLAIDIGNDTMSALIDERFNWKWNRKLAPPIFTNSWQQDYPCVGNTDIAWLENFDRIDINNTSFPKPLEMCTARKDLPATSYNRNGPVNQICWLYNSEMYYGRWPGASRTFYPLVGSNPTQQNPIMSMKDANGNLLIVTGFGTTGAVAPVLAASSPEGSTVVDGTVTWTVVAPTSKGFRVYPLPGATGPVWMCVPRYQMIAKTFTKLQDMIDPIPDDQARHFRKGYRAFCFDASNNPNDRAKFQDAYSEWEKTLLSIRTVADKEQNSYALIPATFPVDPIYPGQRNPQDPSQPY